MANPILDALASTAQRAAEHKHGLGFETRVQVSHWKSRLGDDGAWAWGDHDDREWLEVRTPHNWESYEGYHAVEHGNLHGTAWYRTWVDWAEDQDGERLYVFFEGVGSYARVFCNGVLVGEHAGGRTTFTLDLTAALRAGKNLLAVRAHHPAKIDDLPFCCGGCWGAPNAEGPQPFGIFRPVWLERTGPVRVEPFGVHVLTPQISKESAAIEVRTEIRSAAAEDGEVSLQTDIFDPDGNMVFMQEDVVRTVAGECHRLTQVFPRLAKPRLWGPASPALYRVVSSVSLGRRLAHRTETTFGLRWLEWPEIAEPEAKPNVISPDRRGKMISNGLEARSLENNGLTRILHRVPARPVLTAAMGSVVKLNGSTLPETAQLAVELRLEVQQPASVYLECEIQNEGGTIFHQRNRVRLDLEAATTQHVWKVPPMHRPHLWEERDPYLHRLVAELRGVDGELWERTETIFGIRETEGPLNLARPRFTQAPAAHRQDERRPEEKVLRLNSQPLFLNGTCEYETLLGCDHAFTDAQIAANVGLIRGAGFNAFRDAHYPHNLRYYSHWDRAGMVCWTQMGSNVWSDTPEFRANFRQAVQEWVRERRNHPCVILWGLQNESALPEDFAREMRALVRELDPTSPLWRPTTTCNGGKGSDWNVPQDWSGTYGGNCHDYDLERLQLVGEYGAWRAFGVHTEIDYLGDENDRTESWACQCMETKIRAGEKARDRAVGHFHWVFNTFPNPGRSPDICEGPGNVQIGSVNNKGLVTAWQQPTDLYYLFRANYADPVTSPMVYLVSHTWPDRWEEAGARKIRVFSNCEEVELFNGVGVRSLGTRRNPGRGQHFIWEGIEPATNTLYAVGRNLGQFAACDLMVFEHLPVDESLEKWCGAASEDRPPAGECLFRVSCGGARECH